MSDNEEEQQMPEDGASKAAAESLNRMNSTSESTLDDAQYNALDDALYREVVAKSSLVSKDAGPAEDKSVEINDSHVAIIVDRLEVSKACAESTLRSTRGDLASALKRLMA